jgi:hypothetical protein
MYEYGEKEGNLQKCFKGCDNLCNIRRKLKKEHPRQICEETERANRINILERGRYAFL